MFSGECDPRANASNSDNNCQRPQTTAINAVSDGPAANRPQGADRVFRPLRAVGGSAAPQTGRLWAGREAVSPRILGSRAIAGIGCTWMIAVARVRCVSPGKYGLMVDKECASPYNNPVCFCRGHPPQEETVLSHTRQSVLVGDPPARTNR